MSKQYSTLDSFNNVKKSSAARAMGGEYQRPTIMLLPNYGGVSYDTSGNGTQTPVLPSRSASVDQSSSSFCAGYSQLDTFTSCQ